MNFERSHCILDLNGMFWMNGLKLLKSSVTGFDEKGLRKPSLFICLVGY